MASPRQAGQMAGYEYLYPGYKEKRSYGQGAQTYRSLESQIRKKSKRHEMGISFDEAFDFSLEQVKKKYPDRSEEDLYDDIVNMTEKVMLEQSKAKHKDTAGLKKTYDLGGAAGIKSIEPAPGAREKILRGEPWQMSDEEIIAEATADEDLPLEDRITIRNSGLFNLSPESISEDSRKKVAHLMGSRYGPPAKSKSFASQAVDAIGAPMRAIAGLSVGAREQLSEYGPLEIDIPGPIGREQSLAERKDLGTIRKLAAQGVGGMGPQPYIAPLGESATGATYGFDLGKALGAVSADPSKLGQIFNKSMQYASTAWEEPGTEADVATFLGKRLGQYRDMATAKAVEETGIEPAPESSSEQNHLAKRSEEIFKWLVEMDSESGSLNHPLVTQFMEQTFSDPLMLGSALIKAPLAGIRYAARLGEGVPYVGKGISSASELVSRGVTAAKQGIRTGGKKIMQTTGFGYAPESLDYATIAEQAPELHEGLAKAADIVSGKELEELVSQYKSVGITSADEMVELGAQTSKDAETMRLATVTTPGRQVPLYAKESKLRKLLSKVGRAGKDDETQRLLFLAKQGDQEALNAIYAIPGRKGKRAREALDALDELPDEHLSYLEDTGQRHAFNNDTGYLEYAGKTENYVPHITERQTGSMLDDVGEGAAEAIQGASDFNLGSAPRAAHKRVGGGKPIENAYRAWERTLKATTGTAGAAGVKTKNLMKWATETKFVKSFRTADVESASAFAKTKTATTGVEWDSLDHIVNEQARTIFGTDAKGASDFVRRTLGDLGEAKRGETIMIVPRPLGETVANYVAMRGPKGPSANKIVSGFMDTLRPLQSVFRSGVTVPSMAFQISQVSSVPGIMLMAHGPKGLNPLTAADALKTAWYAAIDGSDLLKNSKLTKMFTKHELASLGKRKLVFPEGEATVDQITSILRENGRFASVKARLGIAEQLGMTTDAEKGAFKYLSNTTEILREGLDRYFFRPFHWTAELVDNQQRASIFMHALRNPNDPVDIMRALEFTDKWSVGNMAGLRMGPTERAIREGFNFYGFLRWTHQWAGRIVTDPDRLRWFHATIRQRQMQEGEYGKYVPTHAQATSPYREQAITAPPAYQPKEIREGTAKKLSAHKFAMMQKEDPLTLIYGILENIGSISKTGRLDPDETARMVGPGATALAEIFLGRDLRTMEKIQTPFFPDEQTPWWESRAMQAAETFTGISRLEKEVLDIWKFGDPQTPAETIDLATRLAARNAGKGMELVVRYLRSEDGEWATDENSRDYLLTFMYRMYPNSPMWAAVEKKRQAIEAGRIREQESSFRMKKLPDALTGEEQ